jgi:hypothetical protein
VGGGSIRVGRLWLRPQIDGLFTDQAKTNVVAMLQQGGLGDEKVCFGSG